MSNNNTTHLDNKEEHIYKLVSEIATSDKDRAKQIINLEHAPKWLQIELEDK